MLRLLTQMQRYWICLGRRIINNVGEENGHGWWIVEDLIYDPEFINYLKGIFLRERRPNDRNSALIHRTIHTTQHHYQPFWWLTAGWRVNLGRNSNFEGYRFASLIFLVVFFDGNLDWLVTFVCFPVPLFFYVWSQKYIWGEGANKVDNLNTEPLELDFKGD